MRKSCILPLTFLIIFFSAFPILAYSWGIIRYVHSTTNIRRERTTKSRVVGQLKAGQKVKADFREDNWYAVFEVEETIQDESEALGYVYAPLLKPSPPEPTKLAGEVAKTLEYEVVAREDTSYRGTSRMVTRVVVEADYIPPEDQLKKIANQIWESGNKGYDELIVFVYLPDMNTEGAAYAAGEFSPRGLKGFRIHDSVLYGTKWKSLEQESEEAEEKRKEEKKTPKVRVYNMDLDVDKADHRRIRINIRTNLPSRTDLCIWVRRIYYPKGISLEYTGDIFSKDMAVGTGRIDLVVDVDDSVWYDEYSQEVAEFKGPVDPSGIDRISPEIEVTVLFALKREEPDSALLIPGPNGEYLEVPGVDRAGNFTIYEVSKSVEIPFKK